MASDKRKPARHAEVERKFAVVESTVTPSFEGLSVVGRVNREPVQRLDATYFDTPGQLLAAHRITLRRRTGGPDAGWHLKLPAGPETRTEIRLPLDGGADAGAEDAVPDQLRDVVLAIVRDAPLVPVARIETTRTVDLILGPSGEALAEFCDDRVTASASDDAPQSWREWELELAEGAAPELLERLSNRLLDAGAEPAGHGSKLARVLASDGSATPKDAAESRDPVHRAVAEQVRELLVWDRAVREDAWDSVHQMRVVTRKIRSLLRASEDSFGISDDAWVLEELRLLAGILGVARDAEVLAERYDRALGELPADLVRGPVRERLVDGARGRYQSGWRRSITALRSERYFRLLDALEALVASEPLTAPAGTRGTPATIGSAHRRVRGAVKKARAAAADDSVSAEESDEALHKIRKRAKQLRYTAAAFGVTKVADRAKEIQSLLGDHQDSVVSRGHLAKAAKVAHAAGEDTFTYGVLFAREAELARRSEEQLDAALEGLAKSVRAAT